MGDRPADRAAVADLDVADVDASRQEPELRRGDQQVGVGRQGADRDAPSSAVAALELGEPADVDERRVDGQAELQERQQALAAGQDLGASSADEPERLLDRAARW